METNTTRIINRIRFLMSEGLSMRAAAKTVVAEDRATALDVMETIGNWPSSEPELRALQSACGEDRGHA